MTKEKRLLQRIIALVLITAMLWQTDSMRFFSTAYAAESENVLDTEALNVALEDMDVTETETTEDAFVLEELTDKRTMYSKEFLLSNGLHMVTFYGEAVHYEKDGQWADIDNTLKVSAPGGEGAYINTEGPLQVQFPQKLSDEKGISVTKDGKTLSFYMTGEIKNIKVNTTAISTELLNSVETQNSLPKYEIVQKQYQPSEVTAGVKKVDFTDLKQELEHKEILQEKLYSRIGYENVFGTTDIVYDLASDEVKESIIIERYDAALSGYTYLLKTEGLVPSLMDSGEIYLTDCQTGEPVMVMPAPFMVDSAGEYCYDVELTLEPTDEGYMLTYQLPQEWLADTNRQWPVVLDPAVTTNLSLDNIEDQTVYSISYRAGVVDTESIGILQCGYRTDWGKSRFFIKYNQLPSITSENVIIDAKVALCKPQNGNYVAPVEVHKVLGTWDEDTLTWNNQPANASTAEDYAIVNNAGYYYWNITDIVQSWYKGANHGMMFRLSDAAEAEQNTNSWKQFYSSDYSGSYRPIVQITFRDGNGLENYWDYTSVSAGRAGTGYVNNYTGTLTLVREDMGFDGNRMPVSIRHIYNSSDSRKNHFGIGFGWRTNYNQLVYAWAQDTTYYIWEDGDGTKHYFKRSSENIYKDEDGLELTLTKGGTGNRTYVITDKNGNESCFDGYGRLVQINNNQEVKSSINISYTNATGNCIYHITDGAGRRYTYQYANGLLTRIEFYGKGTTCLSSVHYAHAENRILTQITDGDGNSCTYTYNNYLLTSAQDVDSDKVTFTYSTYTTGLQNRVAKIQESSGSTIGGTLEFSYAHNQTALTYKEGTTVKNREILQFNNFGNVISIQDDEGHAQYAEYAINNDAQKGAATSTQRVNQLSLSSKLQNTVGNLVKDGSFEKGYASLFWGAYGNATDGISTESYLGGKSLGITISDVNGTGGSYTREIEVEGNRTVTVSAYVKTTSKACIRIYDTSGSITKSSEILDFSSASYEDWTRLEVSYTPASDTEIYLDVRVEGAGTTYVDCVQLEYAETASRYNLVSNGDFRGIISNTYDWGVYGGSRTSVSSTAAPQLDNYALSMTGDPQSTRYANQTIQVSGNEGDCFVVAGWAKGDSVPLTNLNGETTKREFSIRVFFVNGAFSVNSETVEFNPDMDSLGNWQYAAKPVIAKGAYDKIIIQIRYDYNLNTVYFDGIQLYKEEFGTSYTYDTNGNIKSVQSINGTSITYNYAANGTDLLSITEKVGDSEYVTKYTYDDYHNIKSATAHDGTSYHFNYDDYGNNTFVVKLKSAIGMTSRAVYTSDGNLLVSTTNTAGETTEYSYNEHTGLLESVKYPKDSESTRTWYDYSTIPGRIEEISTTSDTGVVYTINYEYSGDRLSSIETGSTIYSFTYGPFDLVSDITVGERNLVTYNYNTYKTALESVAYGNGDSVQYIYDSDGRQTGQTYEDGETVTYGYDNNGFLAVIADSATGIQTKYFYDLSGRLVKYTEQGEDKFHSVIYRYNNRNLLGTLDENIDGTLRQTAYTYDEHGRITEVQNDYADSKREYTYYNYGPRESQISYHNGTEVLEETYQYRTPPAISITGQVQSYTIDAAGLDITYTYTYDENGNILSISDGTYTTTYVYDSLNQLLRENNEKGGFTHVWTYDNAGNILSRTEYAYTVGELGTVTDTVTYVYGNSSWGDLLTVYDGNSITYDAIGNPLTDGIWTYTWQHGRQLASISDGTTTWTYTYNADGIRTSRSNGATTYDYIYNGSQLSRMTVTNGTTRDVYDFIYDADAVMAVKVNGTDTYYYAKNLQGDIIAILNTTGTAVVEYSYDAWGNIISITGSEKDGLGVRNPLRYRGYVYDTETGFYATGTRYYDPEIRKFICADSVIAGVGGSTLGYNLFTYCMNNPVNMIDPTGGWPVSCLENNVFQPVATFFDPSTNTIGGSFQEGIFKGSGSLTGGYSEFNWRLDDKIKSSGTQDGWIGGFGKASVGNANGKIGIGNDNLSVSLKGVLDGIVVSAQAGLHYKDGFGVGAKAKASVLSGRTTAEFNIFGWQVELGVSGDVLSVGAEATIGIFPTDDGGKQFDARYNVGAGWFGWGYVVRIKAPA